MLRASHCLILVGVYPLLVAFILVSLFAPGVQAQVATAPTLLDFKLINPAVATNRHYLGFSADVGRNVAKDSVLELVNSSIDIDTTIDTFSSNNAWRFGSLSFELNFAPQSGTKTVVSKSETSNLDSTAATKLTLMPVQVVIASPLSASWRLGLKALFTSFNLDDRTNLTVVTTENESINDAKTYKGNFLVLAPGAVYHLGAGFSVGYVAEFLQFANDSSVVGTNTKTGPGGTYVTTFDIQSKDTLLIRKDVVGLGWATDVKGGNNFRLDLSYEKMPPLAKTGEYPYGELTRAVAETTFTFFRAGVEVTRKKGYYVDPYNLIPYFFKVDHLGLDAIQDVRFFGGLKTTTGHGFGASFSMSTSKVEERLSVGSSLQKLERKTLSYGLSYSYVY